MNAPRRTLAKAWAFLKKDFLDEASYKAYFVFMVLNVFFAVLIFYFLARVIPNETQSALSPYGGGYFPFVLMGFAMAHYLDLAMHGMGRKIREAQILGTLEALLVTPTPAWQVLLFSVLYPFIFTSFVVILYLLIGWAAFGVDLSQAAWASAVAFFVLTGASLAPLGILSAAVIVLIKRGEPVSYIISGLSYLLSGVFYPVAVLPDWLQAIAQLFPLTHGLEGLRLALLSGKTLSDQPVQAAVLLGFSVVLLPLSLWLFNRALKHARKTGGLHHY